ncbi:MAG: pseudouridylate synthase [Tannerella sp.]|jgi:predicted hotdog family 3-hydroxylacyl-ACP dehydratase|nr:pseudouridylate synthase [Tannerella sp.]
MIADFNIVDLLPHRPPFIMVDKLIYYDPIVAKTVFTVREDNLFCENGYMEEAGLIENIAQTCAARTGYKEKTEPQRSGEIKIGVIGMIKKIDILRKPRIGETLVTTTRFEEEIFNATIVSSTVETGCETIATCELKIYLTDKVPN